MSLSQSNELKRYAKTGWNEEYSEKVMRDAWLQHGVLPYNFLSYQCDRFTDEEIHELGILMMCLQNKRKKDAEFYINVVSEKTGWDKSVARHYMNLAKQKGYTYRRFITKALYALSFDELENLTPFTTTEKRKIAIAPEIRERTIQREKFIMHEMGWTYGKLKIESLKSKIIAGTNFNEYFTYKLYKHPAEEGLKYITEEVHLKLQLRYCNYAGDFRYFDNKVLFCETFKDYINRGWFRSKGLKFDDFEEKIKSWNDIIVKEINGLGGHGVVRYAVNISREKNEQVYQKIASGDFIIEERVVQHPAIAEFEPNTLNTIRIMSMNINGKCEILNAVMKFGSGAVVDNVLEGNGCVAGIDLNSGIICTDGVNKNGEVQIYHPNSKKKFRGFQIPCWETLIETVKKASQVVDNMPYIGWDVAIKNNGEIVIIEGNHNQAGFLVQYPFAISEEKGKRYTIEHCLHF